MNATQERRAERYLAQLDRELGILPAVQRAEIIDDVESHILDSLERGRDIDQILAGLGTPREAAKNYADELDVQPATDPEHRAERWLSIATVGVGVIVSALMLFIEPELASGLGLGGAVLAVAVPVLLGATPLIVPRPWGSIGPVLAAIAATAIVIAGFFLWGNLVMFTPLMFMLWAAAVVPSATRSRGTGARLALRIIGGVAVALPGIVSVCAVATGTVEPTVYVVLLGTAIVAVGALFACGVRIAYVIVTASGAATLVASMFDPGLLFLGFWSAGGMWFALGIGALAGTRGLNRPAAALTRRKRSG
ncbi:DUF1700 domain-containing protein [Microbacterium gubbeenense]|uniref:DUF1700 domain-containing protein n=1 Tax=Microbacterium gubbeenense TaxID=159896 RepID=UPI003F9D61FE